MQDSYKIFYHNLPGHIRLWLNNRGITDEMVNRHFIGWNGTAITIPIFDMEGKFSFFKFRKDPGDLDEKAPKYWYEAGKSAELYGLENLRGGRSPLIICEGELDRLTLESKGFAAVTSTGGSGTFKKEWVSLIPEDISLFLCYDNDRAGHVGMQKVAEMLPQARIILLPSEIGEHGDITDFFTKLCKTEKDLLEIMQNSKTLNEIKKLAGTPVLINEPNESKRFQFTLLRDLLNEPEEKVDWVVEGLLPSGGFSAIIAKPKVGKSTLARQVALSVARGEQFLGCPTTKGAVLYVSLEEKRSEIRNHFKIMGADGREDLSVYVGSAPEEAYKWLEKEVESRRPVLVIIDTLFRLARVTNLNDYAEVIKALDPLLNLARQHKTHVMGIHHARKSPGDGGDSTLGSTATFGSIDTAIILKKSEKYRTIETQQRYGNDMEPMVLSFDTEFKITELGDTKGEADVRMVQNAIIDFLDTKGESVSEPDIAEGIEGRTIIKRKALRDLVQIGGVVRIGAGKRNDPFLYSRSLVPDIYAEQENKEKVSNYPNLSHSGQIIGTQSP